MAKNYPSFFPIIYHDISIEIPAPFRGLARRYYYGWQFLICGGCVLSTIAGIIFWASASGSSGTSYTVVLSGTPISYIGQRLLILFLFPISYFWLLYWPLYKALKKNRMNRNNQTECLKSERFDNRTISKNAEI